MNSFQRKETQCQADYKKKNWPDLPDGLYRQRPYPHILPEGHLDKNFYPPLYEPFIGYLEKENIALHSKAPYLTSSQVCCFNFLFPWRLQPSLAPKILARVLPGVEKVSNVEFEYTGPEGATEWLGEPGNLSGGQRGRIRTSVDAAIWWESTRGTRQLTLVEWKYTESELGSCGGYKSPGNRQKDKCDNLVVENIRPMMDCYVATGKSDRTSRHYWGLLEGSGISVSDFTSEGCPFRGPFNQLLRLYLLRQYCEQNLSGLDKVDVVIMGFKENESHILKAPNYLHVLGDNLVDSWNALLTHAPPLRWLSVEDWLPELGTLTGEGEKWREYINERYCV